MSEATTGKVFIIERWLHYFVILFTSSLIAFAVFSVYVVAMAGSKQRVEVVRSTDTKGAARPLPDFLIDGMKPDELGQLKP